MELECYDPGQIVKLIGLRNIGVLCHFNSLIQALLGCSSFNRRLTVHAERLGDDAPPVIREYLRIFHAHVDKGGLGHRGGTDMKRVGLDDCTQLLGYLIAERRERGLDLNLNAGRQEDMHEGLFLFLEIMGPVSRLFNIRHTMNGLCTTCNHQSERSGPMECMLLVPALGISTKAEMEDYIRKHTVVPEDYRCESCNTVGRVAITHRLKRISEIIVLVFQKDDVNKFFPPELDFYCAALDATLNYRATAQVEHHGHSGGGHYRVLARRNKPIDFDTTYLRNFSAVIESEQRDLIAKRAALKRRQSRAMDSINRIRDSASGDVITARKRHCSEIQRSIDDINQSLSELMARKPEIPGDETVFLFDDDRPPQYVSRGFFPTPNTYVVFYQYGGRGPP